MSVVVRQKVLGVIFTILVCWSCNGQSSFELFVQQFPTLAMPIDSIPLLGTGDALSIKVFNEVVWASQPKENKKGKMRTIKPKVYKNGQLLEIGSFGKANDLPMSYETVDGKTGEFRTKLFAIGHLNLHEDYVSVIVKTFNSELAYFDLFNFSKDGVRLSAVPLFTYTHEKLLEDKIGHVITRSNVLADGTINWLENNRGLKTSRLYKLRDDGYFEIVKEEKSGEFEY